MRTDPGLKGRKNIRHRLKTSSDQPARGRPQSVPDHSQQTANPFTKNVRLGDQAQNQIAILGEVIKVSRMDDDRLTAKQVDGEILVALYCRNTHHRIPSP